MYVNNEGLYYGKDNIDDENKRMIMSWMKIIKNKNDD